VARFRLESEMRGGRYWEGEEGRCRICGWAEETWEHVVEVCIREGEEVGRERILEILDENGRGEMWMKRLQRRRGEGGRDEGRGEGRQGTNGRWTGVRGRERERERE